jgi:hypothetical protein
VITFNGQKVLDEIAARIDAQARALGEFVVKEAKINASGRPGPIPRTGHLRDSISYAYDNVTHAISFIVGAEYGVFVEMGTRHSHAYPYLRPALNAAATIYGFQTEMLFANTIQTDTKLLAHGPGFQMHKSLTRGQKWHVRDDLKPVSQRHHVGNVSRAKLTVRTRRREF